MLAYQKSSAAFSLTTQLLVCVKFSGAITAVRSCVRMGWVGDDFWYPSMRNPPTPSSLSELSNASKTKDQKKAADPKINGFLNLAGGIGEIRTLDKALHPILP